MAWRIDECLVRAELDNRVRGRVTGRLWFLNLEEPVTLELTGNPWRDLAGHFITIINDTPSSALPSGFRRHQVGTVGDITASQKVKVPDVSLDDFIEGRRVGMEMPFHWANCLYLEWYSKDNGRVVIESPDYRIQLDDLPTWTLTESEERVQREANRGPTQGLLDQMVDALATKYLDDSADESTSEIEAEADAEDARMNLLLDRVEARIRNEKLDADEFDRVYWEEREKLRKEWGEPEPEPLAPMEEVEREQWIDEMNEIAQEAIKEMEKNGPPKFTTHPLVEECRKLGLRLHRAMRDNNWVAEGASQEHPLNGIADCVQIASGKLAGALNGDEDDVWPPPPLFAGNVLVRLKKARNYLRDALAGLDAADEQRLAVPEWRSQARIEIVAVAAQVEALIKEVRDTLA